MTILDVRNQVENCVWSWPVALQQTKIDNVFTAWYTNNKELLNNLGVNNQLENST